MKRHWWSLTLSWPNDIQGMFLTAHDVFFKETKIHIFVIAPFKKKFIYILVLPFACMILRNNVLDLLVISMVGF